MVSAYSLPYGNPSYLLVAIKSFATKVATVQDNDDLLRQATQQAKAVTHLVQKMAQAKFLQNKASLEYVVVARASLESLYRRSRVKTPRSIRMSFSSKGGSSVATALQKIISACTALVGRACEMMFILAVGMELSAYIKALYNELSENASARCTEFATTLATPALHGHSLDELQDLAAARRDDRIETLHKDAVKKKSAAVNSSEATLENLAKKCVIPVKKLSIKEK